MKVGDIANKLNYHFSGNPDSEVLGLGFASNARRQELAVIFSPKDIKKTQAESIIIEPAKIIDSQKVCIFCSDSLHFALVKIANLFILDGIYPDYSLPGKVKSTPYGFSMGDNVIFGKNVQICPGAIIEDDVTIGDNCVIGSNTVIHRAVHISDNVNIGTNCSIGANAFYRYFEGRQKLFSGIGTVIIGANVNIGNNVVVQRGTLSNTTVGEGSNLGNLIDIGHDVVIGKNCFIVSQTGIAGNSIIGNNVTIYGQVGVKDNVCIDDNVVVHAQTLVTKNIPRFSDISGEFSFDHREELRLVAEIRHFFSHKENK